MRFMDWIKDRLCNMGIHNYYRSINPTFDVCAWCGRGKYVWDRNVGD